MKNKKMKVASGIICFLGVILCVAAGVLMFTVMLSANSAAAGEEKNAQGFGVVALIIALCLPAVIVFAATCIVDLICGILSLTKGRRCLIASAALGVFDLIAAMACVILFTSFKWAPAYYMLAFALLFVGMVAVKITAACICKNKTNSEEE